MKPTTNRFFVFVILLLATLPVCAQKNVHQNKTELKTYVIEREIPQASDLTAVQLKEISQKSCNVLRDLGPGIQWVHSYVTGNKIYCIYKAENIELIREHAKKGGFPANSVNEVTTVISPQTAQ